MCAAAASTKKTGERVKPRFKIRNRLSAYWVQRACEFSGKNPAELVAALQGETALDSERKRFERYADENASGSMNLNDLKKFIDQSRKMGFLPQASGVRHWSEFLLETDANAEETVAQMLQTNREFSKTKANLIAALISYQACIAGADRARSIIVESDDSGEIWEINSEMLLAELTKLKKSISSHELASTFEECI